MVALTAVVVVLPLALAAPGGAADVNHLHTVIEDALRRGLPDAPEWVFDIPVVGPSFGGLWNRWAADITALGESLQPYFGILLEGGLTLCSASPMACCCSCWRSLSHSFSIYMASNSRCGCG